MKSTLLWALVILNVALLYSFLNRVTHENIAQAQPAGGNARRMGDYLVVSGEIVGGSSGVVYVVDTTNELLGAMAYDESGNKIDVMPVINLKPIFEPMQRTAPVRGK
jgi:hypothetical protein